MHSRSDEPAKQDHISMFMFFFFEKSVSVILM